MEFNREVNVTCTREHWTFGEEWCIQEGGICYKEEMMAKPKKGKKRRKGTVAEIKKAFTRPASSGPFEGLGADLPSMDEVSRMSEKEYKAMEERFARKLMAKKLGKKKGAKIVDRVKAERAVKKAGAAGFKAGKVISKHPESRRRSKD